MTDKVNELRGSRKEVVDEMEAILHKVESEERDFNDNEEKRYGELEQELDLIDEDIAKESKKEERAARIASERESMKQVERKMPTRMVADHGNTGEFRNLGEFFHTIVVNPGDTRLNEVRVQQMKNGVAGGFAVPEQFRDDFLQVPVAPSVIRPRAFVVPAGDPPDSKLTMPALDQRVSQGGSHMYGGVTVYHDGESATLTESTARIQKVSLEPKRLTAYMTASNELLANWMAAGTVIPRLMREAINGQEDYDFLRGDGVNKAMGVINSGGAIDYARATANQVSYADVVGMYARLKNLGGSPVWITSQTCIPQLTQLADASSANIWVQNAAANVPPSLLGIPVIYHDRSPALGSKGDLILADLSAYLIKDGSGPIISMSEHFRFQNNEVAFRVVQHVDGQAWLNEPIALEGSTANTVSPFVVLN